MAHYSPGEGGWGVGLKINLCKLFFHLPANNISYLQEIYFVFLGPATIFFNISHTPFQ